ncbi:MAG: flagellar biosynthetic protein FliO, partial [Woeseiaceae bacterium]
GILTSTTVAVGADVAPSLPSTPGLGGGDVLNMVISMLFLVAVIVVLGWLYSRSRFVGSGNNDAINVVATRALGPKERLLIVEVADQQLLVGMTATAVQTLHVFDKPVAITKSPAPAGFAGRLRTALQEIGK